MKTIALILLAVPAFAPPAPRNPCSERVFAVGQAIATMENTRAELHNPGGLSINDKPLRFSSYAEGEAKMLRLIWRNRRLSIRRLMAKWNPVGPEWYSRWVAERTGLPLDGAVCEEARL